MKTLQIGEFKAQLSQLIDDVQNGETIELVKGKKKVRVALLVPPNVAKPKKKRKLGILEGKVRFKFAKNFKMTDEELLDLRG